MALRIIKLLVFFKIEEASVGTTVDWLGLAVLPGRSKHHKNVSASSLVVKFLISIQMPRVRFPAGALIISCSFVSCNVKVDSVLQVPRDAPLVTILS